MLFADVVETSRRVGATTKRTEKVALLAALIAAAGEDEVVALIGMLIGQPRQGRIGVGWSTLAHLVVAAADAPSLTIGEIDAALTEIGEQQGSGSQRARQEMIAALHRRATADEQVHLQQMLTGGVRQGANEGVVADGVARANGRPAAEIRRAAMLLGDLGAAAIAARRGEDLDAIGLTPLIGVQPMLASTAASVGDALAETGRASVEWKLDGARVQVHRQGSAVRVFTRSLREIGESTPQIVAMALELAADEFVLDGEALGLDPDGNPLKFQDTMSAETGRQPFFFDLLHIDGRSFIDEPLSVRKAALAELVPQRWRLPTIDTDDAHEAEAFADASLEAGHEGVMVKAVDSPYQAGRRGATWRKVKPVHTLDLVVLAVERGHGRRRGWLSNLHLGALGPDGEFVMVGKTFKGLTDALLRWQTETFPQHARLDDGFTVWLRPEIVVEIAVDGVQRSTRYPGGVALRFARVKQYRNDKRPDEADTIATVRAML